MKKTGSVIVENIKKVSGKDVKVKKACKEILEGKAIREALALKESSGADEDKVMALLKFLGLEFTEENIERVDVSSWNGNLYTVDGNSEFLVCTDDEADEEHKEGFMNLVDDMGLESFSPNAQKYILENFVEDTPFVDYYQDDMKSYAEDILNESESPMSITVYDENTGEDVEVEVTNRLFKECLDNGIITESDLEISDIEDGEYVGDEDLVELWTEYFDDPTKQGYESGAEWFKFNFGDDYFLKFAEDHASIDWDEVCEWTKGEDGRGNILSSWDGEENEEYYNGKTYYIYCNDDPDSID